MKVMLIVKATADSEAGTMPSTELPSTARLDIPTLRPLKKACRPYFNGGVPRL